MAEEGYKVILYVYDLTGGMAAQMSVALTGEYFEAIYHTGIGYNNREWYFGGGEYKQICSHLFSRAFLASIFFSYTVSVF